VICDGAEDEADMNNPVDFMKLWNDDDIPNVRLDDVIVLVVVAAALTAGENAEE